MSSVTKANSTSFPGSFSQGGKKRDPGNEVDANDKQTHLLLLCELFILLV